MTNEEQYWVVMRRDDAERGFMDGLQVAEVIAGPFPTWEAALDAKPRSVGAWWYTIAEGDRPAEYERRYSFARGAGEFHDAP